MTEQVKGPSDRDTVVIEGVTVNTTTVGLSDDFPDEDRTDVNVPADGPDVNHAKPS